VLVTVSGSAILERPDLVDLAKGGGGRIILASGALLGLDAVRAAAEGVIASVQLVTRKPPRSLANAPFVLERGIDLSDLRAPLSLFDGTAREGARAFPTNVNVAAALSLAGIGADRTRLQIWADPTVTRNCHQVSVEADCASFSMVIENVPSAANPSSAQITALSVIATLRALTAPLRIGA
jgi:aspartate dehydrogenase